MSSPLKVSLKSEIFSLSLIVLGFVFGFYFYQYFPDSVATHWDFSGQVNGYSSRGVAAFLLPAMMAGMYLLFLALPYFDPKKDQYAMFASIYHQFKDLLIGFLFVLFLLTGLNGLGQAVDIGFWTPLLIGGLFAKIGWLLKGVKMNWFMGIRTPWTLSSETVWDKTHQASGWVFTASGLLIAATTMVAGSAKLIVFISAILLLVFSLPVYSYILYAREKKNKQ